jgi:hypothetical protein
MFALHKGAVVVTWIVPAHCRMFALHKGAVVVTWIVPAHCPRILGSVLGLKVADMYAIMPCCLHGLCCLFFCKHISFCPFGIKTWRFGKHVLDDCLVFSLVVAWWLVVDGDCCFST